MWLAVKQIVNDIIKTFNNHTVTLEHLIINGWIGQYEFPHNFGIIKVCPKSI